LPNTKSSVKCRSSLCIAWWAFSIFTSSSKYRPLQLRFDVDIMPLSINADIVSLKLQPKGIHTTTSECGTLVVVFLLNLFSILVSQHLRIFGTLNKWTNKVTFRGSIQKLYFWDMSTMWPYENVLKIARKTKNKKKNLILTCKRIQWYFLFIEIDKRNKVTSDILIMK
jgi:hypothetical protein